MKGWADTWQSPHLFRSFDLRRSHHALSQDVSLAISARRPAPYTSAGEVVSDRLDMYVLCRHPSVDPAAETCASPVHIPDNLTSAEPASQFRLSLAKGLMTVC